MAANEQIEFPSPAQVQPAPFIFLIAPTGKEQPLSRPAGHGPASLGFVVFAAFKPFVGFHLHVALL